MSDVTNTNTNTTSNPLRDTQEAGHRMSESIEQGWDRLKENTVGDSILGNRIKETSHQASNRVSEGFNRFADGIKQNSNTTPTTTINNKGSDTVTDHIANENYAAKSNYRDGEEASHRLAESAESTGHQLKESTVGSSPILDRAKEFTHAASNRVSETMNRVGDSISHALGTDKPHVTTAPSSAAGSKDIVI